MAVQSELALNRGDLLLEVLNNATGYLRVILLRAEASALCLCAYTLPAGWQTSITLSGNQISANQC